MQGHLSVIGAAFDIFCVFVQGVDVVKEVDLGKNVKSLTLNVFSLNKTLRVIR